MLSVTLISLLFIFYIFIYIQKFLISLSDEAFCLIYGAKFIQHIAKLSKLSIIMFRTEVQSLSF